MEGRGNRQQAEAEAVRAGQVRNFRISNIDSAAKKIELELL